MAVPPVKISCRGVWLNKSTFWRVPNFWQPFLFLWISKFCVFVYKLTRQPSIRFLSLILQESNLCSVLKRFSYLRNEMALHVNSAACFFRIFSHRNRRVHTTTVRRGVASEDFAALKSSEEEKLKLGASELKVTRLGIGAWSWGDTSYWNNFEWDGKSLYNSLRKSLIFVIGFLIFHSRNYYVILDSFHKFPSNCH